MNQIPVSGLGFSGTVASSATAAVSAPGDDVWSRTWKLVCARTSYARGAHARTHVHACELRLGLMGVFRLEKSSSILTLFDRRFHHGEELEPEPAHFETHRSRVRHDPAPRVVFDKLDDQDERSGLECCGVGRGVCLLLAFEWLFRWFADF